MNLQTYAPSAGSFLGAVATAYTSRYDDISDICFVFPNKRSSTFFLQALSGSLGSRAVLAPEVLDIAAFMAKVAQREPAMRIDMLFRLYKVYCGLLGKVDSLQTEDDLLDFDRFAPWGETLLGDFSEVDMYDVDAEAIFRNVRDYRSIASNFLTEEQIEVIERYFGYRPAREEVEGFWRSVGEPDDSSRLKQKFIELWKLLPELYSGLSESLEADGLAMPGGVFRKALRRVEVEGADALPWSRVVFVGFNMISTSEAGLFARLRDTVAGDGHPYAEFFWDATGPVLGASGKSNGPAVRAIHRYQRLFPSPEWAAPYMAAAERSRMPVISVGAAPSNVAQTKIAAMTLNEWIGHIGLEGVSSPRTAVVVPDENLLMPLLHSLPPQLESVNLTMGYSMRYTSVSSFVYHLRRLQGRRRRAGDRPGYLRDDIQLLLAHPLVHVLIGTDKANLINGDIANRHLRVVTLDWLARYSPVLAEMLEPIPADADVSAVTDYIDAVLARINKALAENGDMLKTVNSKIERSQIAVYRLAVSRFLSIVKLHGISMSWMNVFHLIDRLVAGEKVTFEGKPLRGLQVMGLLETRALDFDRIIILSMNDKIMPSHARRRTFIPDTLRRGFGMPTATQGEELYSYYFYRLISRATDVALIYDARAGEGMRSGGKSRFLLQLDMLYAPGAVVENTFTFSLDSTPPRLNIVEKTDRVLELLDEFKQLSDGRNLSASALMNYCKCPLLFYYKNVVGLKDDSVPTAHIDPVTQGNIVHEVMLHLYFPENKRGRYMKREERIILDTAAFESILADKERICSLVVRAVNKLHYGLKQEELDRPLKGTVLIVAERLMRQIADVVEHDMGLAPVELIGGELSGNSRIRVGDSPEVNMRYALDRVDRVNGQVRIVDYKTGSAKVKADKGPEQIFNGTYSAGYLIQLLVYARLLIDRVRKEEGYDLDDIGLHIYNVNTIADGSVKPEVKLKDRKGVTVINSYTQLDSVFMPAFESMLTGIFDKSQPFGGAEDDTNCRFCAYHALCGKP